MFDFRVVGDVREIRCPNRQMCAIDQLRSPAQSNVRVRSDDCHARHTIHADGIAENVEERAVGRRTQLIKDAGHLLGDSAGYAGEHNLE